MMLCFVCRAELMERELRPLFAPVFSFTKRS